MSETGETLFSDLLVLKQKRLFSARHLLTEMPTSTKSLLIEKMCKVLKANDVKSAVSEFADTLSSSQSVLECVKQHGLSVSCMALQYFCIALGTDLKKIF